MNVLAIDTSNQPLGVAVLKNSQVVAEYSKNIKKNHSVQLMPVINQLMNEAGLQPSELDRIAVANGPGSFTGIRIGLTTAKTLAWSLNIPVVAMSSLELVAHNGYYFEGLICPFFDARRGQVYTGLYQRNQSGIVVQEEEVNIMLTDWLEQVKEYNRPVMFLSHDLDSHCETILDTLGDQAVLPDLPIHLPQAGILAKLATKKEPLDVHSLTPNYLRLAEAEAKWIKKQQET